MDKNEIIYGVFKEEIKNRFLCLVTVDGQELICYIPSSCRLSNFLDLTNRTVLLRPTLAKNARTKYAVYAVKTGKSFLLLNLSRPNRIIEEQIHRRFFSFLGKRNNVRREATIGDYKADLYIEDTKTIVEIKSILAFDKSALFPTVYSERAIKQLQQLSLLLDKGYKACYCFVSLNPQIGSLSINPSMKEYHTIFSECLKKGMLCIGFSVKLNSDFEAELHKRIEISLTL